MYRKPGYETGKVLGARLLKGFTHLGARMRVTSLAQNLRPRRIEGMIRWGVSSNEHLDSRLSVVINKSAALNLSTHKLNALVQMKRGGVNCPEVWTNAADIASFPVLGRNMYHHGGLDAVKYDNAEALVRRDHYVKFIDSTKEFRVHVFCGEVIRITRKVFRGFNRSGEAIAESGCIRNDIWGWGHKNVGREYWPEPVCAEAIKALEVLGLDFGAVDIIMERGTRLPFVLEVNSAPRLNSVGQEVYCKKICELFGLTYDREAFLLPGNTVSSE